MKYVSDDGKVFSTEKECTDYEKAIKLQQKIKDANKEANYKKLEEVLSTYNDLLEEGDKLADQAEEYYEKADDLLNHLVELVDDYNNKYDDSTSLVVELDENNDEMFSISLHKCESECDDCPWTCYERAN